MGNRMRPNALTISLLLAAGWSIGTQTAFADAHSDRQAVMHANGAAVSAIDSQVIGIMNSATVKAQAQILIDNGGKIATLFGPGTDQNDSGALPAIWTDAAGFKAANDKFIADAKTFLDAPDRIAFAHALVTVQADCAACHATYRVKPAPGAGRGGRGAAPADAPPAQ
jgi:cytochrome c556